MGRSRRTTSRAAAAPTVVGATPATDEPIFALSIQQRQAAQDAADLAKDAAARERRQPAKLKPTNFFTAPPRTQIMVEKDTAGGGGGGDDKDDDGVKDSFKQRAAAPANLGEISGSKLKTVEGWGVGCQREQRERGWPVEKERVSRGVTLHNGLSQTYMKDSSASKTEGAWGLQRLFQC